MLTLNDGRAELWQWDTGRTLSVDADCSQVHFSNKVFGRSIDVDVVDGIAIIPDILLQTDKNLNVWAFVGTAENGYTKISKTFKVNRRNKPADYVFTSQEQITLKDATAILEEAKDVANDAIETAKKAEAIADNAAKIADEMKKLADQVEKNTETATKAKADALTAQAKAEEARNAAETAKKAAEEAASNAGDDASAASAAATRAQNASNDAAAALDSIQVLYQEMQTWAHGVIQDVDAAGNAAVQSVQSAGDAQVQRVTDEGATQTANAKAQADAAAQSAEDAAKSAQKAEKSAAVYDDVVADVTHLKHDVAAITPDDTAVDGKPWTSKKILDSLCMPFEESGNPVQVYPVENYPLGVKVSWEPVQEGSGDPSPDNIRPIKGRDSVSITHTGKNIIPYPYEKIKKVGDSYTERGITYTLLNDGAIHIAGISESKFGFTIAINNLSRFGELARSDKIFYDGNNNHIFIYPLKPGQKVDETVYPQIEVGTTATSYEAPMGHRITILTLPETVYGGTLDPVTGDGQETWKFVTLNGTESWHTWGINANNPAVTGFYTYDINDYDAINVKAICSHSKVAIRDVWGGENAGIGFATVGETRYFIYSVPTSFLPDISAGHEVASLKAYLAAQNAAGTPLQIAYKLAEPVPFTATGAQPIPALSGVNTVLTDADGVVVTGAEDPKHTITELKNAIISLGGNV